MILALSLALITLFASSIEPFKISKGPLQQTPCNQCQLDGGQHLSAELSSLQGQAPQFSANQWELRGQRELEYPPLTHDYFSQRPAISPTSSYYREPLPKSAISYEQEYARGEQAAIRAGPGSYLDKEKEFSLYSAPQSLTRQPQYSPSTYGTQQLALVLIRPLQLSPQQQYPSYANLFMQAPPQATAYTGQRLEPLSLPQFEPQQQQFGPYPGGDKYGGVLAKSHEKLSKLKSHLEKFAADAKAKLSLGTTYHYNGEETVPGPGPQPLPVPVPGPRPQLVARPVGVLQQQQLPQGQLEMTDIQLSKVEQQKIRDNQHQEKLEQQQQQELPVVEQEKLATKQESSAQADRLPVSVKQQQQVAVAAAEESAAKSAADASEGFGRRQSASMKSL